MSDGGHVALRDFIERVIAEKELRRDDQIRYLREAFDSSVAAVNKAREIQATEYERRLADLNHAHAEAQRVLHTYVSQSVYEKDREAFRKLESSVDIELASRVSSSKGVLLLFQILSGVAFIISVGVALLTYTGRL